MRHETEIKRPNVLMAWTKFVVGVAALLLLAGMGSGCDESWQYDCGGEPYAPADVYSITGDEEVTLYWTGVDMDRTDYFLVYRSKTANGRYYEIGHASHEYFVDHDVRNGETYFYAVTAVNPCDFESDLSYDLVHDTPRPEGYNARLYDANSEDWRRSGWDFNSYRAVSWDDRDVDVYFVNDDGAAYIVAADIDTDIQDAGYTRFDDVDWAPERGWSPTGAVEAIVGHTYIVWTRDNHFAKVRITDMSSNRIEFDWAYQVDNGNPELKPRTRDEGNAFNSTSLGLKKTS